MAGGIVVAFSISVYSFGFYGLDQSSKRDNLLREQFYEHADINHDRKIDFNEWNSVYQKLGLEENLEPQRTILSYEQMRDYVESQSQ